MHLIIFVDNKRNWYNCALSLYSVWRLFYCNFCCKWSVCTTLYVNKPDYCLCNSFSCFWQKLIFALCFQMNQLLKPTVSWVSLLGALNVVVANVWLPLCVCVCCTCTAWSFTYPFFLRKRSLTSSLCCLSSCVFAADTICRTCNQHFYLPHPEHDNTRKVCEICLYHCEMCDNRPIVLHPGHVNLLSESWSKGVIYSPVLLSLLITIMNFLYWCKID